jgi:hypothetical protein
MRQSELYNHVWPPNAVPEWGSVPQYVIVKPVEFKQSRGTQLINSLLSLTLFGFVTYALHVSNKETVFEACGRNLWNYTVSRLILGCLSWLLITVMFSYYIKPFLQNLEHGLCTLPCFTIFLFAYHVTLLALGIKFSSDAMGNTTCTTALSEVSFTNSPLLAQLAYVFIALDSIILLLSLCLCAMGMSLVHMLIQN